jgi:hydroxyacylglutathione hydrolase
VFIAAISSLMTATNCFVVASGDGEQCVILDPGLGIVERLDEVVAEHRLHPVAVLLTHGHIDHTFSVLPVCDARGIPAYIHSDDRDQIADPWAVSGVRPGDPIMGIPNLTFAEPDDVREFVDGATLQLAGLEFGLQATPGHTPGSTVFGSRDEDGRGLLFSGDVLFAGTIGRTDFPGGSMEAMLDSLRRVILPMDDATVVYPGHGPSTTIGRERRVNPFLLDLLEQS